MTVQNGPHADDASPVSAEWFRGVPYTFEATGRTALLYYADETDLIQAGISRDTLRLAFEQDEAKRDEARTALESDPDAMLKMVEMLDALAVHVFAAPEVVMTKAEAAGRPGTLWVGRITLNEKTELLNQWVRGGRAFRAAQDAADDAGGAGPAVEPARPVQGVRATPRQRVGRA